MQYCEVEYFCNGFEGFGKGELGFVVFPEYGIDLNEVFKLLGVYWKSEDFEFVDGVFDENYDY